MVVAILLRGIQRYIPDSSLRGGKNLTAGSGGSTLYPLHTAGPPQPTLEPDTVLANLVRRRKPLNSYGESVDISPPFTTSESQFKDLRRPKCNRVRARITTYKNDVRGRPVICVDIPRTPSLKVAQSRLDLYNNAEDENDGDDDIIPAV